MLTLYCSSSLSFSTSACISFCACNSLQFTARTSLTNTAKSILTSTKMTWKVDYEADIVAIGLLEYRHWTDNVLRVSLRQSFLKLSRLTVSPYQNQFLGPVRLPRSKLTLIDYSIWMIFFGLQNRTFLSLLFYLCFYLGSYIGRCHEGNQITGANLEIGVAERLIHHLSLIRTSVFCCVISARLLNER